MESQEHPGEARAALPLDFIVEVTGPDGETVELLACLLPYDDDTPTYEVETIEDQRRLGLAFLDPVAGGAVALSAAGGFEVPEPDLEAAARRLYLGI